MRSGRLLVGAGANPAKKLEKMDRITGAPLHGVSDVFTEYPTSPEYPDGPWGGANVVLPMVQTARAFREVYWKHRPVVVSDELDELGKSTLPFSNREF